MAFEDVVFPYYPMKHNISKSIIDPVSVVSNGNREYRIKRQAWERYEWTLPVQTMTNEQKEEIKAFLLSRNHSLNSFKFVDPDMAAWVDTKLTNISADNWEVNLPLNNFNQTTSLPGTHPCFNANVTNVTVNGSPELNFTVSVANGIPKIFVLGSPIGSDVRLTGGIPYFTVRLASSLGYTLAALDTNNETLGVNHAEIKLIEVFGEY